VTREEVTMRKQRLRNELSSLRKRREVIMKIAERKKIEKIQKKSIEQILQEITNVLTAQRNLIMFLRKLESEDITLHAVSSEA
jgi:predicted Zn-dependent peptidase